MLRQRGWILEAKAKGKSLPKLPPKTKLSDLYGMKFSSWGGKVALVTSNHYGYVSESYFDPEKMQRLFQVRYAIDPNTKKPFNSSKDFQGVEPYVFDSHVPYEKTGFQIPGPGYSKIVGGFSKSQDIWVKMKPKDLFKEESIAVARHLDSEGYYESTSNMSASNWKKAFKIGFDATWDEFEGRKMRDIEDAGYRGRWDRLSGVYARTKDGRLKYIVLKKR
jgi:hypothetical protein